VCSSDLGKFVIFGRVKYTTDPVVVEIDEGSGCLIAGRLNLAAVGGFNKDKAQILGHDASEFGPCLKWYDVFTCPT
jgi:hypothetical protein